jgi:hypothetical protein
VFDPADEKFRGVSNGILMPNLLAQMLGKNGPTLHDVEAIRAVYSFRVGGRGIRRPLEEGGESRCISLI